MNAGGCLEALDSAGFHVVRTLFAITWQSLILLVTVGVLSAILRRRRASAKRALWVVALLSLPLLPVLAWVGTVTGAPQAPVSVMPVYKAPEVHADAADFELLNPQEEGGGNAAVSTGPLKTRKANQPRIADYPWALCLIAYAVGALAMLALVISGWLRIRWWVLTGRRVTDDAVLAAFDEAREHLGLSRRVAIVESERVDAPLAIGTLQPVVLLPRGFGSGMPYEDLRAVALHEAAHVKSQDSLVLELASLLRAVLFFHPLVWFACKRIALLSEEAADDVVVEATGTPVAYAGMLARIAENLVHRRISMQFATAIVFSKSAFVHRVKAILSDRRAGMRGISGAGLLVLGAFVAGALILAAALPAGEAVKAVSPSSAEAGAEKSAQVRTYNLSAPDDWKEKLSVGELSIVGPPFYGAPWSFGLSRNIHLKYPLKNLTSAPLYVYVDCATEPKGWGYSNVQSQALYLLETGDERVVDQIVPITSSRSFRFRMRMALIEDEQTTFQKAKWQAVLNVERMTVSELEVPSGQMPPPRSSNEHFTVKSITLAHSDEEGNVLRTQVVNNTDGELPLGMYVGVNDPDNFQGPRVSSPDWGFFDKAFATVPAGGEASLSIPYEIPDTGSNPVLAYTLFEPRKDLDLQGVRNGKVEVWDVRLVSWGAVDLREAAKGHSVQDVAAEGYEVSIPDAWKSKLSVGRFSIVARPFYAVMSEFSGLVAMVRVRLPLKNLTPETLYVKVNYRTEGSGKEAWNTGWGVYYTLAAGEERIIDTIAPVTLSRPLRFRLLMGEPHNGPPLERPDVTHEALRIDPLPLPVPEQPAGSLDVKQARPGHFAVKNVRLDRSEKEGNILVVQAQNRTGGDLPLEILVAVNDPKNLEEGVAPPAMERGFSSRFVTMVAAKGESTVRVPYTVPEGAKDPLLVFTAVEPREEYAGYSERDERRSDVTLVCWGSVSLRQSVESEGVVLPVPVPVEERAKLTAETKSEHFIFRYRPGSLAEKDMKGIIDQREAVYKRMSTLFNMELPGPVQIDLYPDITAKGLGSGTPGNIGNTVNDSHIAEVYSSTTKVDPAHEVAHVFSYRFPGYPHVGDSSGHPAEPFIEGFAQYFEAGNDTYSLKATRKMLDAGTLPALDELPLPGGSDAARQALIGFLLETDPEKFKQFYVRVLATPTRDSVREAFEGVYSGPLEKIEAQWRRYLETRGAGAASDPARTPVATESTP